MFSASTVALLLTRFSLRHDPRYGKFSELYSFHHQQEAADLRESIYFVFVLAKQDVQIKTV